MAHYVSKHKHFSYVAGKRVTIKLGQLSSSCSLRISLALRTIVAIITIINYPEWRIMFPDMSKLAVLLYSDCIKPCGRQELI